MFVLRSMLMMLITLVPIFAGACAVNPSPNCRRVFCQLFATPPPDDLGHTRVIHAKHVPLATLMSLGKGSTEAEILAERADEQSRAVDILRDNSCPR